MADRLNSAPARTLTHAIHPWMVGKVACPAEHCPHPRSLWTPNKGSRVPMHRHSWLLGSRPCSGVGAVVTPLAAPSVQETDR